ncbi:hypothetical protein O7635_19015 [Asanoa sp. WMMD1127]|uniref:hypothetical protein n=1 Tax=Asanoa sp. WMMD1127 TaxID=3016107 RepID=UPI002415F54F|nr:hypothetical protein [Asanoa sp. WMMD1127]MDG4823953.1 hypothetical protein [Asanoa sp. WMMD1127]
MPATPACADARSAGLDVALVDHDALARCDASGGVAKVPRDAGEAIYRGWMLRNEAYAPYARFAAALAERGVHLRTTATHYRQAHELPSW